MNNDKIRVKVFLLYGRNTLLNVISGGVYSTKFEAEEAALKYFDEFKIEEIILTFTEENII